MLYSYTSALLALLLVCLTLSCYMLKDECGLSICSKSSCFFFFYTGPEDIRAAQRVPQQMSEQSPTSPCVPSLILKQMLFHVFTYVQCTDWQVL